MAENMEGLKITRMLIYRRGSKSVMLPGTIEKLDKSNASNISSSRSKRKKSRKKVLNARWSSSRSAHDYMHFTAIKSMLTTSELIASLRSAQFSMHGHVT